MRIDFQRMTQLWGWYLVAAAIIFFDQITKSMVSDSLRYGELIEILPFFDITLLHNYGAAFSFLDQQGGQQRWFLVAVSALASVVLIFWWLPSQNRKLSILAMTFILGGAVGNLVDRAALGYVVDFIAVHYDQHRFPAFNIADSAISIGALFLFLEWFIFEPRAQRQQDTQRQQDNVMKDST